MMTQKEFYKAHEKALESLFDYVYKSYIKVGEHPGLASVMAHTVVLKQINGCLDLI